MIDTLLKLANQESPELIEKIASYVAMIEKLDLQMAKETVAELQAIAEVAKEKVASSKYSPGNFALVMGASAVAGLGTAIATDLYDAAKRGLTKSTNYKRILQANPRLMHEVDDPKKVKPAYDALHRYAPEFTSDPMLGGALLRSIANSPPGAEAQLIDRLISSRKNLVESKSRTFSPDSQMSKAVLDREDKGRGGG